MRNQNNDRVYSGTATVALLILSPLIFLGPVQDAMAQQNTLRNDTAMEIQGRFSGSGSGQTRSGSMTGYFDPESGGLDVPHGTDLQVTDLIELPVRDERGETIGEVEDVIMNRNDTVLAVIAIEGFLGLGEDLVTVPVSELEMGDNYTHVIYSTRQENLEDRPSYTGGREYRRVGSTGEDETDALQNEPEYEKPDDQYGYTPRWPYGQPYGYPRAYRYERYETRETPPEYRNRYDPYPYRWENYTMYDELPSYDRYGEEGFQSPRRYRDRRTDSPRQRRMNTRFQEPESYYDPEPEAETESSAVKDRTEQLIGRKVENEQGIAIGTVDDLITNRKGEPVAVISVSGYTGGSGEKLIGVPVSDLEMNQISESLRYGASRKEIRNQESISENE